MNVLYGIVLFIATGGAICAAAAFSYYAMVSFEQTGGWRSLRRSRDPAYWRQRAFAWHLVAGLGLVLILCAPLTVMWASQWHPAAFTFLCVGMAVYVVGSGIAHDHDRRAARAG